MMQISKLAKVGHRPGRCRPAPLRIVTRYYLQTKLAHVGKFTPIESTCWQAMREEPLLEEIVLSPKPPKELRPWVRVADGRTTSLLFRLCESKIVQAYWVVVTAKMKGE